jgi:hypothetical protein
MSRDSALAASRPRTLSQLLTEMAADGSRDRISISDLLVALQDRALAALLLTYGFRTAAGMNAALRSGALDVVGLARLLAIDPDAPAALLQGRDSPQQVRPISTGLKVVDRMGIMEVLWYTRQLKRIAKGGEPRPGECGLSAFLKSAVHSGWGTFRTQRLRSRG